MRDLGRGLSAPLTFLVKSAQWFVRPTTAFQQAMIDDTTMAAVAALDRDDMPGPQIAADDFVCRNFEVLVVTHHTQIPLSRGRRHWGPLSIRSQQVFGAYDKLAPVRAHCSP
jgi:hypothetical protein